MSEYERISSVSGKGGIALPYDVSGIMPCPFCCRSPQWKLWKIDVSQVENGFFIEEYVYQWSLTCSGALHSFGVSYDTNVAKVIRSWNNLAQIYCDDSNIIMEDDPKNDLRIYSIVGYLTFAEFVAVYKSFYGNPTKNIIFNVTMGNLTNIKSNQIEQLAEHLRDKIIYRPEGAKTAFVVNSTVNYGIIRTFQNWVDAKNIKLSSKIFGNIDDAAEWIKKDN